MWRVSFIWDQLWPCYLEHNLQLVSLSHDGHLQCSWSPLLQGRHQVCHPPDTGIINLSCLRELVNKPWHGVVSLHESSFINVYLSRCWNTKHVLYINKINIVQTILSYSGCSYQLIEQLCKGHHVQHTWMKAGLAARPTNSSMCMPLSNRYTPSSLTFSMVHLIWSGIPGNN